MAAASILWRAKAPFHESIFGIHEELLRGRTKTDESNGKSDSYMSPICGCWLSNAYSSEVPERHMPTTKTGPGLMGSERCSRPRSKVSAELGPSIFMSTAVLML